MDSLSSFSYTALGIELVLLTETQLPWAHTARKIFRYIFDRTPIIAPVTENNQKKKKALGDFSVSSFFLFPENKCLIAFYEGTDRQKQIGEQSSFAR